MPKIFRHTGAIIAVFTGALFLINAGIAIADTSFTAATTIANTPQTQATRTITVASVPQVAETLTIGLCAITVTGTGASDTDCSNNNALIATTTDTTTALIATRLRSLTSVSDTGHGALTVGGSGTTASFTTTGTETSATPITASISIGTDFTLTTVNTTGVVPVAQTATFNFGNISSPYTYTITINGNNYSSTFLGGSLQTIVSSLVSELATDPSVNCTAGTSLITCVAKTAGTSFTDNSIVVVASAPVMGIGSGGSGSGYTTTNIANTTAENNLPTVVAAKTVVASQQAQISAIQIKIANLRNLLQRMILQAAYKQR
jgi:hypothetical protein